MLKNLFSIKVLATCKKICLPLALCVVPFSCAGEDQGRSQQSPAKKNATDNSTDAVVAKNPANEESAKAETPPAVPQATPAVVAALHAPCAGKQNADCDFSTRTFLMMGGKLIESITAGNRYFNFDGDSKLAGSGSTLASVARYKNNICKDVADDQCTFETRVIYKNGVKEYESITAFGKVFDFDASTSAFLGALDLKTVARYIAATGPCSPTLTDNHKKACVFDTRMIHNFDGALVESVTAYGRFFNWSINESYKAWPTNGNSLASVERYAAGPCAGKADACKFSSRTMYVAGGKEHESISAYGKFFNFDATNSYTAWPSNGSFLSTVSRYAQP